MAWLGLGATLLVGIGEFLVHFSSLGYAGAENFLWLANIPGDRITIGHFLMIAGMPLYIFGYFYLYQCLRMAHINVARSILVFGIVAFMVGSVWAGSRALLTEIVKADNHLLIDYYKTHYEVLVTFLRVLIFMISALWAYVILSKPTGFPKWLAFVNPIVLLGVLFLLYFTLPTIGSLLVPSAMNVTHFIFFSLCLIMYRKPEPK